MTNAYSNLIVKIPWFFSTRGAGDTTSSTNPLDATLIHPESYSLAERLLTSMGFSSNDVGNYKLIKYFRDLSNGERTALMSKEVVSNKVIY